jgi:hypothetical protein
MLEEHNFEQRQKLLDVKQSEVYYHICSATLGANGSVDPNASVLRDATRRQNVNGKVLRNYKQLCAARRIVLGRPGDRSKVDTDISSEYHPVLFRYSCNRPLPAE